MEERAVCLHNSGHECEPVIVLIVLCLNALETKELAKVKNVFIVTGGVRACVVVQW